MKNVNPTNMPLSPDAKQLLKEKPELVKELARSFNNECFKWSISKTMDDVWNDFVISNTDKKDYEIVSYGFEPDKIHSVKRLSDGEIFCVGEKVKIGSSAHCKPHDETIEKMIVSWVGLEVQFVGGGACELSKIQKSKLPLFTTQDSVAIYEGDTYHSVSDDFIVYKTDCASEKDTTNGKIRMFSTKEAAENYVLMNKPCFSLSEIYSACDSAEGDSVANRVSEEFIASINKLIKQKCS